MGQALLLEFEPARTQAQLAIAAAQAGDWTPANDMELAFLNDKANGVYPGCLSDEELDHIEDAVAVKIIRHDDGLHVLWVYAEDEGTLQACAHEDSESGSERGCPDCMEHGLCADTELAFVETDIDGRILNLEPDVE